MASPSQTGSGRKPAAVPVPARFANVTVVDHPVVQQLLTRVRDMATPSAEFRRLVGLISRLMTFELTREMPSEPVEVLTPLGPAPGTRLARPVTLVPVLRAGQGMVEGVLELLPDARVGYVGIFRDEDTLQPVVYYQKLPADLAGTEVIVIDPMLATAGSLNAAIDAVKAAGASRIRVLCLVAAPEGIDALARRHGNVPVITAAIDRKLNEAGYIVPGLGDAGDRLFGTH